MGQHTPDLSTAGARARWAREQAGLTMGQAARQLGVSVPLLSAVETNRPEGAEVVSEHGEMLSQMATLYDVSVDFLAQGRRQKLDEQTKATLGRLSPADAASVARLLEALPAVVSDRGYVREHAEALRALQDCQGVLGSWQRPNNLIEARLAVDGRQGAVRSGVDLARGFSLEHFDKQARAMGWVLLEDCPPWLQQLYRLARRAAVLGVLPLVEEARGPGVAAPAPTKLNERPFPWRADMQILDTEGKPRRLMGPVEAQHFPKARPDERDGATTGAFRDAVREAWGDPTLTAVFDRAYQRWCLTGRDLLRIPSDMFASEWDALMAAWAAAHP